MNNKFAINIVYLFFTLLIFSIFYFAALGIIETPCSMYKHFTKMKLTSPIILIVVILLRVIDYYIINKIQNYYLINIDPDFNGIIISDKYFMILTVLFLLLQNYAYYSPFVGGHCLIPQ